MEKPGPNPLRFLLASLYSWLVTTFFGAILLDIVYANIPANVTQPSGAAAIFSEGADFLLCLSALPLLATIGAIGASWGSAPARNLFILSALFLALEFLVPTLFSSLILRLNASLEVNLGPWIRLLGSARPFLLAFAGLWKLAAGKP